MLPEANGRRGLAAKGIKQSSHENAEVTHVETYAGQGLGSSRASRQRPKTIIS